MQEPKLQFNQSIKLTPQVSGFLLICFVVFFVGISSFYALPVAIMFVAGAALLALTIYRPLWTVGLLLVYLPFEPFLLQFVPNEYYVYVRFGSEAAIYLVAAAMIIALLAKKITWRFLMMDILFMALLMTMLAATIFHWNNFEIAFFGWRNILRFMILLYILFYLRPSRKQVLTIFLGLLAVLIFESALSFLQWGTHGALDQFLAPGDAKYIGDIRITSGTVIEWEEGQRAFGTLGRYEQLGTWLMFLLIFCVAALYEYRGQYRPLLWFVFIVGLLALILTYSRTSWFGFLLGAAMISIILKKDKRVLVGAILIFVVLLAYQQYSGLVVSRLVNEPYTPVSITERIFEAFSYSRWRSEYFGIGRIYFLIEVPRQVMPLSPIFGFGPGQFGGGAAAALYNTTVYELADVPFGIWGIYGYIDNNWFSLWAEIGTLGIGVYLMILLWLIYVTRRIYLHSEFLITKTLALGYFGFIFAFAFVALVATFLEVRTIATYFWAAGGSLLSLGYGEGIVRSLTISHQNKLVSNIKQ